MLARAWMPLVAAVVSAGECQISRAVLYSARIDLCAGYAPAECSKNVLVKDQCAECNVQFTAFDPPEFFLGKDAHGALIIEKCGPSGNYALRTAYNGFENDLTARRMLEEIHLITAFNDDVGGHSAVCTQKVIFGATLGKKSTSFVSVTLT